MPDCIFQFPLKQHIGAASLPVVTAGDYVLRGQLIAKKPDGTLGANLHSSVSGMVLDVNENQITVNADNNQSGDFVPLNGNSPLELIEESGIVGLGGAGFPTYAKLCRPFSGGGAVIVNAAECEPILNHNITAISGNPEYLIRGLRILMEIMNADEGIIAIKKKHSGLIDKLKSVIPKSGVHIAELTDIYPAGEERAIVRDVLGKLLSVNSLPSEANAVVVNAETALRVREAVELKKPLIDKDLTVAGKLEPCTEPDDNRVCPARDIAANIIGEHYSYNSGLIQVFRNIPLGIPVNAVFDMAGGLIEGYGEIIMGGPFTGKRTFLNSPVIKTTGGLIAAECFMRGPEKLGLLVCACGANQARLEEIAASMGSNVVGVEFCKQAIDVRGSLKCENPGHCPGQVQKVMALKKAGAEAILISNCTDCTNTVMNCAPKLKLPVYHCTDGALRAVNHPLVRRIHE